MSTSTIARPAKTKTSTIALETLTLDRKLQPREQMNEELLREYAEAMERGESFPAIRVITDGKHHWLVDGWHRERAARSLDQHVLFAEISSGTFEDAEDYVLTVNRTHGLRRTHADVQKAIRRALTMRRWQERSDNWIAKHIGCSDKTVSTLRVQLESTSEIPKLKRLRGEDGKDRARTLPPTKTPARPSKVDVPDSASKKIGVSATPPVNEAIPLATTKPTSASATASAPATHLDVHFSSESGEHYTPAVVIEAVQACLDHIDLDPCSNGSGPRVPAKQHYTERDDGLSQKWTGRVYMNPPYGRVIDQWVEKLVDHFKKGQVVAAVALLPARTDTEWFARLRDYPVCFIRGRLTFGGNENPAPFPSMTVYLGRNFRGFVSAFAKLGDVWQRVE